MYLLIAFGGLAALFSPLTWIASLFGLVNLDVLLDGLFFGGLISVGALIWAGTALMALVAGFVVASEYTKDKVAIKTGEYEENPEQHPIYTWYKDKICPTVVFESRG